MSTLSPSIPLAATTPSQHYAWIAAVSAALDSLGITRTSDTGQVVLTGGVSTLPLPPSFWAAGSWIGGNAWNNTYEIRKMSAAGLPDIYLRIDYGVTLNGSFYNISQAQAQTYLYPAIQISVGGSTDGAGNIKSVQTGGTVPTFAAGETATGTSAIQIYKGSSGQNSGLPLPSGQECDFASDGQNYLTIMLGENAPTFESRSVFVFGIERSINPNTGAYDGDGYVAYSGHNAGNSTWNYGDFTSALSFSGNGGLPALAPPFALAGNVTYVDLFPFAGATSSQPKGAPTMGLSAYGSAIAAPVLFPTQLYSTSHNYKANPRSVVNADPYSTGTRLALRFD